MSKYSFIPLEHAHNVQKCSRYSEFEYEPFKKYSNISKMYIKLEENDIKILDEKSNFLYKGRLNIQESQYYPNIKLVYELESSPSFIGGLFILEKNMGQLIYNGSGLTYTNAFRGIIGKVTKYEI